MSIREKLIKLLQDTSYTALITKLKNFSINLPKSILHIVSCKKEEIMNKDTLGVLILVEVF
jgi:hypothetical protein